jgi:hypothetical protein
MAEFDVFLDPVEERRGDGAIALRGKEIRDSAGVMVGRR